jgi:hypothetical protein
VLDTFAQGLTTDPSPHPSPLPIALKLKHLQGIPTAILKIIYFPLIKELKENFCLLFRELEVAPPPHPKAQAELAVSVTLSNLLAFACINVIFFIIVLDFIFYSTTF